MSTLSKKRTVQRENTRKSADVNLILIEANMNMPNTDFAKPAQNTLMIQRQRLITRAKLMRSARKLGILVATALFIAAPTSSQATPLSLSTAPLFLSPPVQPNIFFLADDSGSMDWNTMTSENDGTITLTGGNTSTTYTYIFPQANNNYCSTCTYGRILPSEAAVATMSPVPTNLLGVWRGRYSGYNTMYYNPDVTYTPWAGVDAAGVAYANASPTAARLDPYLTSGGTNLVNLTSVMSWTANSVPNKVSGTSNLSVTNYYPAQYYTWTDSPPLNGIVDAGDAHTLVEIKLPTTTTYAHTLGKRLECGAGSTTCTYAQELQNFANWFSYYRRRILTSKNAIGKVIAPSSARMGLGTLNNNGTVNTQISLMNASTSTAGNKRTLLNAVYSNSASNGTPLRTMLDETGKYYECVSGNIFGLPAGSASCPILPAAQGGACQKNFTVMTTDGYYNDSFTFPASPYNKDGDGNTAFDGGAYADLWDNTLADVAMNYYERDLSPLANQVTVAGVDTATHQHMVTYTVAFGVNGTLTADPPNPTAPFAWPDPSLSDTAKIDDLRHAAYNSRGQFLSAKDPVGLSNALSSALGSIGGLTSSASAVAVNSHTLTTSTTVYQARFTSDTWSGDLRALPISTSGIVGTTELWKAGDQLKSQNWNTGRQIITRNATTGTAFRWASLSASEQASLNDNPTTPAVDSDGFGSDRLNWLRGDLANEGTGDNFRSRVESGIHFKLGDLANSAPVYVGAPGVLPDSLETVPHSSFSSTYASRARVIYVGGNDGMLHGFDAANGNEVLAYVPSMLYPDLSKLTDPAYTHRYYVDGSPTAGDVFGTYSGCATSPCWRTVLVGGLAGGGKGVFALDVTDPSLYTTAESATNSSKIALWELTAATDNDLGYTFSQPTIAKVRTGTSTYKWVAIFGNGYNSVNESAALYVVDIQNGNILRKIVVDAGGGTSGNGLSTPLVLDQDGDYIADYVYAGDLKGNLWKFDLTGSLASWSSAFGPGGIPRPLFQAVDSSGVAQPITERPAVSRHPVSGITGNMVYVGTGRYIDNGDKSPPASPTQTFYGIWDKGVASTTVPVARADLLPQTITTSSPTRSITSTAIAWRVSGSIACAADGTGQCLGWRVDLPAVGEMSVTNPVLLTTDVVTMPRIIFTTLVPNTSACSAGGTGWLMELNPINGGSLSAPFVDTNGDGVIDASDGTPAGIDLGIGLISEPVIISDPANQQIDKALSGSTGAVKLVKQTGLIPTTPPPNGRKSWRQLR